MAACSSCGAPMVKVPVYGRDTKMPLDPEPHENGNVLWNRVDGVCLVLKHGQEQPGTWADKNVTRHKPHFATCPNADQHRQKGRRRGNRTP